MLNEAGNNRRIAKNTLLLYVRMIIILIISLYTSRALLSTLGAENFGIYNVVGGVVVLFSFLTNAMTSSTQRFLNYYLGLNEEGKVNKVFNTSIITHFTILILIFVLAETIGLWLVKTKLNIPVDRETAVIWVYQMSVITALINIMVIPYRASVIAAEQMSIFAFVSILEVILKLIIVLILPYIAVDKLILYVILLSLVSVLNLIVYEEACRKKLNFTKLKIQWDKEQYIAQISFSWWYLLGGFAMISAKQGLNILINIFYGVTVNASVGIANQVRSAIYGFITSFQTAFNPQIVKLYATGESENLLKLIYRSSKFSFFLLFILSFPIILFCKEILSLWLVEVPEYAVIFTQIVMLEAFTEALSAPLWTAIGATGKVQKYQLYVSVIILSILPIVYMAFMLDFAPITAFWISLTINCVALLYRLLYIRKYVPYKIRDYFKIVILPCLKIALITIPLPIFMKYRFCSSIVSIMLLVLFTVIFSAIVIFTFGLDRNERSFIINFISKRKSS